jgi:hypothetical protein
MDKLNTKQCGWKRVKDKWFSRDSRMGGNSINHTLEEAPELWICPWAYTRGDSLIDFERAIQPI